MSALDTVRKKYGNLCRGTDKADKSPSVSSVSPPDRDSEKFAPEFSDQYARTRAASANRTRKTVEHLPRDLPPGLEERMHAMAHRWRYTADELAEVLELARRNHEAWLLAVALDERREAEFRAAGVFWWDA